MKRKRKLLKTQIKLNNLDKLAEASLHYYCATGIDNMNFLSYEKDKKKIHRKIRDDILNDVYKFVRYKEKLIIKNRKSKPRCISIPTLRDRLTNKVILETLKEYYPECAKTKLPQECIKTIRTYMEKYSYDYFIKLDLSDFYGNISHAVLLNILRKKIKDRKFISLISKAIRTPTIPETELNTNGIPQGLSISNILAQIYMLGFDNLNIENCHVVRYVDDILVLCKEKSHNSIYNSLTNYLKCDMTLTLNNEKERKGLLMKSGFDYLGYHLSLLDVRKPKLSIKEQNIQRLERRLIDLITRYKHQHRDGNKFSTAAFIFELNIMISGTISSRVDGSNDTKKRYGWMFFYSQINDLNRLYHLDRLIMKKIEALSLSKKDMRQIKTFVKSYYEIRYNLKKSDYIFRPDELSINDMKKILSKYYGVNIDSNQDVEPVFRRIVFKKIKNSEADIIQELS